MQSYTISLGMIYMCNPLDLLSRRVNWKNNILSVSGENVFHEHDHSKQCVSATPCRRENTAAQRSGVQKENMLTSDAFAFCPDDESEPRARCHSAKFYIRRIKGVSGIRRAAGFKSAIDP